MTVLSIDTIDSPVGELTLTACDGALCGLWLSGQKYFMAGANGPLEPEPGLPIFQQARAWLTEYFTGKDPGPIPPVAPVGTPFRQRVWTLLAEIPYGTTVTYGELAARLARETGVAKMSSRAVGGAVGHNPISIILPCHRVIGAGGSLTGYAGGIERKLFLLELEGVNTSRFTIPARKTTA